MHRSHLLRWLALSVAVLSVQCLQSLSDDCTKTRTCQPAPQLGPDCLWHYPDGGIWTDGPHKTADGLWVWPSGQKTETQTMVCPLNGLMGDAGPIGLPGNCPEIPCDEGTMCDEATHRCVRCADDSQCKNVSDNRGALPVCDTRIRDCVVCLKDQDCGGDIALHCKRDEADPRNNRCVECASSVDCDTANGEFCDANTDKCTTLCSGQPNECKGTKPICSGPPLGRCVQCLTSLECPTGFPQCNTARKECVQCVDDTACAGLACNSANHCVECVDDSKCATGTHCDVSTNKCVPCVDDSQCTTPEASRCNAQHQCAPCNDSSQCEGARSICDLARGLCVECQDDAACGPNGACDVPSGRCVGCVNNDDCNRDPTLARCDTAAHVCVPCGSASQCTGKFGNKNICRNAATAGECVECTGQGDCAGDPARSKCNTSTGVCGGCTGDGDCSGVNGKHACLVAGGPRCVECTNNGHCAGNANGPACKTETNTCVQCTVDTDCHAAGASRCVNNQCVACVNDNGGSHCGHILNGSTTLGVCDTSGATGVCVQCTGKDRTACGANVCNSLTKVCSPFAVGSAGLCEDCVSDAHCPTSQRCIQETFGGATLGFSCFLLDSAGACPQTPFSGLTTVTTIDGDSEQACLLRHATCAAFNQANNKPCTADTDCGETSIADDGACDTNAGVCSLPCASGIDCPSGSNASCLGGVCQL